MRDFMRGVEEMYLDRDMRPFYKARRVDVPKGGWLRRLRQVEGHYAEDVARHLQISMSEVFHLERMEQSGTITLRNLRRVASALDCEVVYGVIPRERSILGKAAEIAERKLWKRRVTRSFAAAKRRRLLTDGTAAGTEGLGK